MKINSYEKQNRTCFKKKVIVGRNFRGWNWKTEIENETKEIQRYLTTEPYLGFESNLFFSMPYFGCQG